VYAEGDPMKPDHKKALAMLDEHYANRVEPA
jgi:hypothetical protein